MTLENSICKDCEYNYIVVDDMGLIHYCIVADIYEDMMKDAVECSHYRDENNKIIIRK